MENNNNKKVIQLVRGVDKKTGKPICAYVMLDKDKAQIYRKKVEVLGGSISQEGAVVIYQGIGENPPEEITQNIETLLKVGGANTNN